MGEKGSLLQGVLGCKANTRLVRYSTSFGKHLRTPNGTTEMSDIALIDSELVQMVVTFYVYLSIPWQLSAARHNMGASSPRRTSLTSR
jgi:hypothetical protein